MVSRHSLSQALTPKRARIWPTVLLIAAVAFMITMAVVGFLQVGRTERVIIVVRPLAYGQQIAAADLATVEVARHRPVQLMGMGDAAQVIGKWAARPLAPHDLLQPSMLLAEPPRQPVYPSGEELTATMVAIPFSLETTGPITHTDVLNIGFYDESGDRRRCQDTSATDAGSVEQSETAAGGGPPSGTTPRHDRTGAPAEPLGATDGVTATDTLGDTATDAATGTATDGVTDTDAATEIDAGTGTEPDAGTETETFGGESTTVSGDTADGESTGAVVTQPYACRLLVAVNVLHVDSETDAAYLELTPYQAQAIRAVQAAGLPLFAERATTSAPPLAPLTRLDPTEFTRAELVSAHQSARSLPQVGDEVQGAAP